MATDEKPIVMRCATHDYPARLWPDGSVDCWWEYVVEARSDDCVLVPTEADELLRWIGSQLFHVEGDDGCPACVIEERLEAYLAKHPAEVG